MPKGTYERTELTITRYRHTTSTQKINRLLEALKDENTKRAQLEARINELAAEESSK